MNSISAETFSDANALLEAVSAVKSIAEYEQLALEYIRQVSEVVQSDEGEMLEDDMLVIEKEKLNNPTIAGYIFNIRIFAMVYEVFEETFPVEKSLEALIEDVENDVILHPEVHVDVMTFCVSMSELFKRYIQRSISLSHPILFNELPPVDLFALKETAALFQVAARHGNDNDIKRAELFCHLMSTLEKVFYFYGASASPIAYHN